MATETKDIDWETLDASKLMCSIEFGEGCEACQ